MLQVFVEIMGFSVIKSRPDPIIDNVTVDAIVRVFTITKVSLNYDS